MSGLPDAPPGGLETQTDVEATASAETTLLAVRPVHMEATPPGPAEESSEEDFDEGGEYQGPRCVLEDFTKCSESHLWKLMMSFYDRKGPDSWAQGIVPHFITCNAFIGRSYAQVLHGFIEDCVKPGSACPLDPNEPLYIIELGTGSGKFSYFMVKALEEMAAVCDFPWSKLVYVMTDFTEANFNFWQEHPRLKKYFDSGNLDAGIFDAVNDGVIHLTNGTTLGAGSCVNPICVVANYLFDTLCHDIFQVDSGVLKEGLVSVGSKAETEPDPLDPEIIQRFDNMYNYNAIEPNYYQSEGGDEPHLERILAWYKDYFTREDEAGGASLLVPIGALRAIRVLTAMSKGRAIVISGDKGNNNPEHFRGLGDPHIAVHGSFSVMVNYHAIGAYFTSRGGFALHNPQEEASLKVSCFVLSGQPSDPADTRPWTGDHLDARDRERGDQWPRLKHAFEQHVVAFGPNDFFVMQKSLKEDSSQPSLKSIVALLKLSDFDPDVFWKFRDAILNALNTCGEKLRADLGRGIPRVWDNYYLLDKDKDIAFEIGRFYYGIRNYRDALKYYEQSSKEIGEHHVTFHNMGLCYYSEGQLEGSLGFFSRALAISPEYEKANSWKERVERELGNAATEEGISSANAGAAPEAGADTAPEQ